MRTILIVIAAGAAFLPVPTHADGNLFVAAGVGRADLSEDFDGFGVDTDSTAWRLTVGWRFNDYLAIEGGYQNFGRFEQTLEIDDGVADVSLKADGFTIGATGTLPLGGRLALFARAGAYFWDGGRRDKRRVCRLTGGYEPVHRCRIALRPE